MIIDLTAFADHLREHAPARSSCHVSNPSGKTITIDGWWLLEDLAGAIEAATSKPVLAVAAVTDPASRSNLDDALELIAEIDRLRAVIRELKAAFGRSDLDGGAKAAVDHPLYLEAAARLGELHDELMGLI